MRNWRQSMRTSSRTTSWRVRTITTKQPTTWLRYYIHEVSELHPVAHDVNDLNNSSQSSSHLSRINLTFDRSIDKWESFRDKFKSMIHDDRSNECCMHYLCSCKEGVVKERVTLYLTVMIISLSHEIFLFPGTIINILITKCISLNPLFFSQKNIFFF